MHALATCSTHHLFYNHNSLDQDFSNAGISTFFCAAVGIACLLVCLGVGLVMTAGDEA